MSDYCTRYELLIAASQAAVDAGRKYDNAPDDERDNWREIARATSKVVIVLNAKAFNERTPQFEDIAQNMEKVVKELAGAISQIKRVADFVDGIAKAADAIQKLAENFPGL